ncbi:MAG: hypothetical protein IJV06_00530 [Bacteroidaceae bacterium]|nr:hypothetical protein [Bacteroidaceae bacterium]
MDKILKEAQQLRLQYYRQILQIDTPEDYALQDYQSDWHEAQATARRLLTSMDSSDLTPVQEARLLLTLFVVLQVGYRDSALFHQATDRAALLLPLLPDGKLKAHLLVHLYCETEDDTLLPIIDYLLPTLTTSPTEEDHYLQAFFEPVQESLL